MLMNWQAEFTAITTSMTTPIASKPRTPAFSSMAFFSLSSILPATEWVMRSRKPGRFAGGSSGETAESGIRDPGFAAGSGVPGSEGPVSGSGSRFPELGIRSGPPASALSARTTAAAGAVPSACGRGLLSIRNVSRFCAMRNSAMSEPPPTTDAAPPTAIRHA